MSHFEVGILCDDGEQETISVSDLSQSAIETEAAERALKYVRTDWVKCYHDNPLPPEYLQQPF